MKHITRRIGRFRDATAQIAALVVTGLLSLSALAATKTVTVSIPATGGTAAAELNFSTTDTYYFDESGRPTWTTALSKRIVSGGMTMNLGSGSGYTTVQSGGKVTLSFTVTANTAAAKREWTYVISGTSASFNVVVSQSGTGGGGGGGDPQTDLSFGPGKLSTFTTLDGYKAVIVGVSGATEYDFSETDGFGATCMVDERIVDAEKEEGNGHDNFWCGPISDIDMIYLSGWAKQSGLTAKYATADDVVDYFRANPKLLRYAQVKGDPETVVEGTYGYNGLFNWFKATTKKDLASYTKKGTVGKNLASTLVTYLGKGNYVMQLTLYFPPGSSSPMWGDIPVSHAVTCVGYTLDASKSTTSPEALTGLYIIDSDNDQGVSGGGRDAPNSIVYCPVYWCSELNAFEIEGLWGWTSEIYVGADMPYKALQVQKTSTDVTVTFDGNGAEDYETEVRTYEIGEPYGEFPYVYRDETRYTFEGWWTARTGGTRIYEDTPTAAGQTTVFARWEPIKAHTLRVTGGLAYAGADGKASVSLYPCEYATVEFDYSKIYDTKSGQELGVFQQWIVSPETAELGDGFNPYDMDTEVEMPNCDVTLTALYVPVVAAYLTVDVVVEYDGLDPDEYLFAYSKDGGEMWTALDGDSTVPLAAGPVTLKFNVFKWASDYSTVYETSDWKVPADQTLNIPSRGTYREGGVTYYEEPADMLAFARFVEASGAKLVTFDANGGTVGTASAWFREGGEYSELPVPNERQGYVFDGWWTAKTGGEPVEDGDDVDFSMLSATNPTIYAHWLKAYTLTVKPVSGGEVTVGGETYEQPMSVSVLQGEYVSVSAPEDAWDASGEELVFTKWTLAKAADLGEEFDATACDTALIMPAADVTLTATYRLRYKKVSITVTGGYTEDPATGDPVAKTKVIVGETTPLIFDTSKLEDKNGNVIGAFQRWVVTPADADYGEDFDPFNPETLIVVPDADVKVTAQYVSPVAAYVTYELATEGYAEEAYFRWSPDGGKTKLASGQSYPLGAGNVTASFYALLENGKSSSDWKAPDSVKLTIPKPATSKVGGITYYEDPLWMTGSEWFVAADGAKQIKFDANGGKVSVASRWYLDGGSYYVLPTPDSRKGYVFDGWRTAKAGGEPVAEGDDVDFTMLDAAKPTLYAKWLKAYTLTLKGEGVTAEYGGETFEGSLSVMQDEYVSLNAPSGYEDAKGVAYLFQCWKPSKSYDFGEGYDATACETALTMPAANLTMTAAYLKESEAATVCMYASYEAVTVGDLDVEPADVSKFKWSIDNGKTWFPCEKRVLVKRGSYSVQWGSDDPAWMAPSAKTKVNIAEDEYDNSEAMPVYTFVEAVKGAAVVYEDGEWRESTAGGTVKLNPADGRLVNGKSVTLTATPANGYAFVGWQLEAMWEDSGLSPLSAQPAYTLKPGMLVSYMDPEDFTYHVQGVFRPLAEYTDEKMDYVFTYVATLGESVPEVDYGYAEDDSAASVELMACVGCESYFDFVQGCDSETFPLTVRATGTLPKGMTLSNYGQLSGTPTAAGTYKFRITATDPAGHSRPLAVTLTVRSLPSGLVGEYRCLLNDASSGIEQGLAELSIANGGKVSGKVITASGTTSFAPTLMWTADYSDPEADGTFAFSYSKESSTSSVGFYCTFGDGGYGNGEVSWSSATYDARSGWSYVSCDGTLRHSDSTILADADFKEAFLGKYYTVMLMTDSAEDEDETYRTPYELSGTGGYLTMTVDQKGAVKYAGKLADGEKISGSSVILTEPAVTDSAYACLFLSPSSYKKNGWLALYVQFSDSGSVKCYGSWVAPPVVDFPTDCSDWDETDEMFRPGLLLVEGDGGVYSALSDLTGYYMSLSVNCGASSPTLEYSYTDGEKQKVYVEADLAVSEYALDGDMLTGGRGGKVTIGKSAAPWKDSEGYYHYDETKPDRYGDTEPITNPGGLTLTFKPATGIFSGKCNLFFDYEVPTFDRYGEETGSKLEHKSVSASYEGVVVGDNGEAWGAAQYSGKYTLSYTKVDARGNEKAASKTYTRKFAIPVSWSLSAP